MSVIVKLKNNIRKYIAVACSLLLIPIFSVNAFAYDYEYHLYPVVRNTYYGGSVSTILDLDYKCDVDSSNNYYYKYNATSGTTYDCLMFGSAVDNFYYPFDSERFDYYVIGIFNLTYHNEDIPYSSEFSVDDVYYYDFYDNEYVRNKANADITYFYDNSSSAISYVFPLDDYSMLSIIEYDFSPNLVMTTRVNCQVSSQTSVLAVPKDTSAAGVNSIITAIANQNNVLGGKLDGIDSGIQQGNDLIENGNESTQSAITDFNEVFEDFNNELDTWEQFDDDIIGEFNAANDNYKTELNNFSLSGSLLNAGNWLSTSMQTVYDNSSDYKMLWLVPLLFGIPILLFIIRKSGDDE